MNFDVNINIHLKENKNILNKTAERRTALRFRNVGGEKSHQKFNCYIRAVRVSKPSQKKIKCEILDTCGL